MEILFPILNTNESKELLIQWAYLVNYGKKKEKILSLPPSFEKNEKRWKKLVLNWAIDVMAISFPHYNQEISVETIDNDHLRFSWKEGRNEIKIDFTRKLNSENLDFDISVSGVIEDDLLEEKKFSWWTGNSIISTIDRIQI